jgi:hypothetical protein
MKRISLEEAKNFIVLNEDDVFKNIDNLSFFTIDTHPDPSKAKDGWEKITYYINKRKNIYVDRGEGNQWLYILSNPSIPNALKIGYTNLSPELRAKQISSSTGVVTPFVVEWAFKCFDGNLLENKIHEALKEYRINNQREFFQADIEEVKKVILSIGKDYI